MTSFSCTSLILINISKLLVLYVYALEVLVERKICWSTVTFLRHTDPLIRWIIRNWDCYSFTEYIKFVHCKDKESFFYFKKISIWVDHANKSNLKDFMFKLITYPHIFIYTLNLHEFEFYNADLERIVPSWSEDSSEVYIMYLYSATSWGWWIVY